MTNAEIIEKIQLGAPCSHDDYLQVGLRAKHKGWKRKLIDGTFNPAIDNIFGDDDLYVSGPTALEILTEDMRAMPPFSQVVRADGYNLRLSNGAVVVCTTRQWQDEALAVCERFLAPA